jgi:hypothetical protein
MKAAVYKGPYAADAVVQINEANSAEVGRGSEAVGDERDDGWTKVLLRQAI